MYQTWVAAVRGEHYYYASLVTVITRKRLPTS